mmetsp:Transcript_5565/g.14537  ORF Transcript_5565/g.14537 Transcript_5565/m.14537 type:complete len:115 (+) Transcript_5565:85-429(+)
MGGDGKGQRQKAPRAGKAARVKLHDQRTNKVAAQPRRELRARRDASEARLRPTPAQSVLGSGEQATSVAVPPWLQLLLLTPAPTSAGDSGGGGDPAAAAPAACSADDDALPGPD